MGWLCPKKEQFALILHFNILGTNNENSNIGTFHSLAASGFSGSVQRMGSFQIYSYVFRVKINLNLSLPARLNIQLRVAVFHATSSSVLNTKHEGGTFN